jgi:hypothetical protein
MPKVVMVRANGGNPVRLLLIEQGKRLSWVANPNSLERIATGLTEPVGVPAEDVFQFDGLLMERIAADRALWRDATPFNMLSR